MFRYISSYIDEQIIYYLIQIYYYKTSKVIIMVIETLTINIDKELKTELRVIAVKQDKTLTDIVNKLIQDFVDENK